MAKKKISIANFNVVFIDGQDEKPLLEYFDTILMPALCSGRIRKSGDSSYRLMNVKVMNSSLGYVLSGIIVKKTILEIKSDLDGEGNLIEKDEKIPTAPYSTFAIYLKNHRMIYAENQKGSPDLRSFRATVQFLLNQYSKVQIAALEEKKEEFPIPIINIIGIPARQKLKDTLKDVEKINKLTLRFYPLNGDLDFSGMLNELSTDLRRMVGSNKGDIILKSPKNVSGVIEVVEKSEGTVESIFNVQYPGKRKVTINNDMISERMEMDISGENIDDEVVSMLNKGMDINSLNYVSKGNEAIYEENQSKIISFSKKIRKLRKND